MCVCMRVYISSIVIIIINISNNRSVDAVIKGEISSSFLLHWPLEKEKEEKFQIK